MFDYDSQIALNTANGVDANNLTATFPNSGILYLRSNNKTPDTYHIKIVAGAVFLTYDVPTIKLKSFSLDTIFRKRLLFLLPFYIFNLENNFKHPRKNSNYMEQIIADFTTIRKKLDELLENHEISELLKNNLRELINRVADKIANKHNDVKEGVKNIMSGKIIITESTKIFDSGINHRSIEVANDMFNDSESFDKILKYSKLTLEQIYSIGLSGKYISEDSHGQLIYLGNVIGVKTSSMKKSKE